MASRSLSLTAYRALARSQGLPTYQPSAQRGAGQCIWLHAGQAARTAALLSLAHRLVDQLPDSSIVLSHDGPDLNLPNTPDVVTERNLSDHPQAAKAFLDHWQPAAALWDWGALKPNLVDHAGRAGIPMQLTSVEASGFDGRRDRWLPELSRHLLRQFRYAVVRDDAARARLIRLGMSETQIEIDTPLMSEGDLPSYVPSDLEDVSQSLAGRPVWLGARLNRGEIAAVISAHRLALRRSHRLLLVLNPESEADRDMALDHLERASLRHAVWSEGEEPSEAHQVLLADLPGEHGLWYRVSPVTYLGQSMSPGSNGVDPLEAAGLGTAILYGPHVQNHISAYTALATASAARIVNDPVTLGAALDRVIAPDVAAGMALAGWEVASQGAEASNRAIARFLTMLGHNDGASL